MLVIHGSAKRQKYQSDGGCGSLQKTVPRHVAKYMMALPGSTVYIEDGLT